MAEPLWTMGRFRLESNALVSVGTIIWTRGEDVVGVSTPERKEFLKQFGLGPAAPKNATGAVLSPADYETVVASLKSASRDPQP